MTKSNENALKQAGETLTDLGLELVGLASHNFDDEVVAELEVTLNHLQRVSANLTALCHSLRQPLPAEKPFE